MKIFYSYTHKDEDLLDELAKHLAPLKEEFCIEEWDDRKIQAGQDLHEEIDKHLETADLFLLLISSDYLASSECKREIRKALEEKEKRDAIVIPVILRPCAWKDHKKIVSLLAIPKDGKSIAEWDIQDEAFLEIYKKVREIVESIPFRLRPEFKDDLIKVEFISQNKESIRLDDLFVFPTIEDEYNDRQINNLGDLWEKNKHVILKGDDRSGKTVICQKIFLDEVENGTPTLLISGSDITSPINHHHLVQKKFQEQFSGSYFHWSKEQAKLLIIDDFSYTTKIQFIDFAKDFFERIIVVMSDDEYIAYFKEEERFADFELFNLESLGHVKQEELIKKWVNLSDQKEQEISHGKIDQIEDRLNSIILHNKIVPRYPFYILSILQTFEGFMPQNLQITAYGHCYQALITAQLLNIGIQKEDIDSSLTFLSYLAFQIFKRRGECSQDQFEQIIIDYKGQYIVKESVVNRLMNNDSSILRSYNGGYKFNYPFIYYFLLGNFFARNYEIYKDLIEEIAEKSYLKDNAYILIFTIHHTQDDDLIDTVLIHTACTLDGIPAATLNIEETKLLETALMELPEKIMSKHSVDDERRSERERRDEIETNSDNDVETNNKYEADESIEEGMNEIYKSLKNMEILGQILRNKYGSLRRNKIEEAIEFVTDAGLRLITIVTDSNGLQSLEGFFIKMIDDANIPDDDKMKMEDFLRRQIRTMVFVNMALLLNKVVVSIRKPELLEIVEKIYQRENTPAHDLLYTLFLLGTSENLSSQNIGNITNTIDKFKKSNNRVAHRFISLSLQHYVNTHRIRRSLREKLFNALDIDYRPNPPVLKS